MKKIFLTELRAIDPADGQLKTWAGPEVRAKTMEAAEKYCSENVGYLRVTGEAVPGETWLVGMVECLVCTHQWAAVRPEGTTMLECPNCGNFSEAEEIEAA